MQPNVKSIKKGTLFLLSPSNFNASWLTVNKRKEKILRILGRSGSSTLLIQPCKVTDRMLSYKMEISQSTCTSIVFMWTRFQAPICTNKTKIVLKKDLLFMTLPSLRSKFFCRVESVAMNITFKKNSASYCVTV